jgi:hypothetical protein
MPKPSELDTTTTPSSGDWFVVVKDGVTSKVKLSVLKQYATDQLEEQGEVQVDGPTGWGGAAELFAYCDNWMNLYVNGVEKVNSLTWGGGQAGFFLQDIVLVPGDVVAMKCVDYGGSASTYFNYISTYGWQWGTDGTWRMASSVPGGAAGVGTDSNTSWTSKTFDDSSWGYATNLGMNAAIASNFPTYTTHADFIWDTSASNLHITRWFRGTVVAHYP